MWTNGQLWMDRLIVRGNGHCSVLVRANENEHTTRSEAERYKAEVDAFGPLGRSGWLHHHLLNPSGNEWRLQVNVPSLRYGP